MKNLDLLGILIGVVLVVAFFPIGIKALSLQTAQYTQMEQQALKDKNVQSRQNSTDYLKINGGELNAWEVLLTTQIQNYYMPAPKSLSVGATDEDGNQYLVSPMSISSTFEANRDTYVKQVADIYEQIGGYMEIDFMKTDGSFEKRTVPKNFILKFNSGFLPLESSDSFYYFDSVTPMEP